MSSRSRGVASSSPSASASTMTGRMDVEAATDDRRGRGMTTTTTTTTTAPMTTTAMTTMTTRRETRARRPRRHVSTRATGREEWDDAMMTTTNAGTPKTTRRALALALASTVTSMSVVVAPEPARAKFSIFDDDDDPFARNDASRVLDRRGDARETRGSGDDSKAVETRVETVEETSMGEVESTREVATPSPPPPPARVTESSTEVDTKQLLNNQRIKTYNNAPADFPAFIREGYDVSVVHGNDYVVREDGLIVKDYEVGEGESPKDNQECTFEYVAYNENGGTIDSTYRRGEPASTRLGINGMIPGFELGLKDMKPGGRRRIIVPPELGPPTGPATFFSAKQWEVFDIELLGVKSCSRSSFGMVSNVVCD